MNNPESFLKKNWQKQPCYLANAFKGKLDYLSAEQLAGLALETEIESRLISGTLDNNQWSLEHGPFEENRFAKLGEHGWTLLIQSVDTWVPETRKISKNFNFIPNWRFDDLMVSFAADKGGVGPHIDNYDVFLLQASGSRRWRVGKMGDKPALLDADSVLPLVADFDAVIDVIMHPGDVLYIPPNTAHWGESIGESIGYSVGYRSPQVDSILSTIAENISTDYDLNPFFTDDYRNKANLSGKIEDELVCWVQEQLNLISKSPDLIKVALAKQLSQSKLGISEPIEIIDINDLESDSIIQLNSEYKANWLMLGNEIQVFIEGESWVFEVKNREAVEKLVSYESFPIKLFDFSSNSIDFPEFFTSLINTGYITLLNKK